MHFGSHVFNPGGIVEAITRPSEIVVGHYACFFVGFLVFGDFRADLGLPRPRGGHSHSWMRLVPQQDFPELSSKSGLWVGISWPFWISEKEETTRHNDQQLFLMVG